MVFIMDGIFIHMMVGLPASGKSHLAKEIWEKIRENDKGCYIFEIDFDNFLRTDETGKRVLLPLDYIWERYLQFHRFYESKTHIILDGLFLTDDMRIKVLNSLLHYIAQPTKSIYVTFYYFNEDRDCCAHNDENRRDESSLITIRHSEYTYPNCSDIFEKINLQKNVSSVQTVNKVIHWCNTWDIHFQKLIDTMHHKDETIFSDKWATGGTYCNYYGETHQIEEEDEPSCFNEVKELIYKLCPSIDLNLYNKLYEKFVEIDWDSETDYYGGTAYYSFFKCNLRCLYEEMINLHLITDGNQEDMNCENQNLKD